MKPLNVHNSDSKSNILKRIIIQSTDTARYICSLDIYNRKYWEVMTKLLELSNVSKLQKDDKSEELSPAGQKTENPEKNSQGTTSPKKDSDTTAVKTEVKQEKVEKIEVGRVAGEKLGEPEKVDAEKTDGERVENNEKADIMKSETEKSDIEKANTNKPIVNEKEDNKKATEGKLAEVTEKPEGEQVKGEKAGVSTTDSDRVSSGTEKIELDKQVEMAETTTLDKDKDETDTEEEDEAKLSKDKKEGSESPEEGKSESPIEGSDNSESKSKTDEDADKDNNSRNDETISRDITMIDAQSKDPDKSECNKERVDDSKPTSVESSEQGSRDDQIRKNASPSKNATSFDESLKETSKKGQEAVSTENSKDSSDTTKAPITKEGDDTVKDFKIDEAAKERQAKEPDDKANMKLVKYYLVKWRGLPYEEATWEVEDDVPDLTKVEHFWKFRNPPPKEQWKCKKRPKPNEWRQIDVSPVYRNGQTLREYQLEGISWLTFCWYNQQNCILADEMGLGKTIQSLAYVNEIVKYGIRGPFMIIAPLSTIGNWQREFEGWTDLNVITYHGSSASR